jgi:hypothetical protein
LERPGGLAVRGWSPFAPRPSASRPPAAAAGIAARAPPGPRPADGFTQDWFSYYIPVLREVLAPLVGKPVHALEIGVFEGQCTVWLLENVLTHPEATLTWVDTFEGGAKQAVIVLLDNLGPAYDKCNANKNLISKRQQQMQNGNLCILSIESSMQLCIALCLI